MGFFRFLVGIFGILTILGVMGSIGIFLFFGGMVWVGSGSGIGGLLFGLGIPLILFVIGAYMTYYGFFSGK